MAATGLSSHGIGDSFLGMTAVFLRKVLTGGAMLAILLGPGAPARAADAGARADRPAAGAPLAQKHRASRRRPPYRACCGKVYRHVYAEAWYGSQKAIAPVRRGEHGDQVQAPGGAWFDCEFSCEMTIRKLNLGFWQAQGAGYDTNSPAGYPRRDNYTGGWGQRRWYLF